MKRMKIFFVFLFILFFSGSAFCLETYDLSKSHKIAKNSNPEIIAATERLKAAEMRLNQAKSALIPHFTVDALGGKNYQEPVKTRVAIPGLPTMEMSTTPDEASDMTNVSLTVKQPLFTGGKIVLGIKMANNAYLSSYEDYKKTCDDVEYKVSSAYFDVLKTQKNIAILKNSMESLSKYYKQLEVLSNSGIISSADVLRVKSELLNMKVAEIQLNTALRISKMSFRNILGDAIPEEFVLAEDIAFMKDKVLKLSDLLVLGYKNRPDWNSFNYSKDILSDSVGMAQSGYLPTVAATYSTGRAITNYPSASLKYDIDSWKALLVGSWNIFDGFEVASKVAEAKANYNAVSAQEKTVKMAVALDIESSFYNFESLKEKIGAVEAARDAARKSYKLAEANFLSNVGTNVAVLDAESNYNKSEMNYWATLYDIELAKLKINKATGVKVFN